MYTKKQVLITVGTTQFDGLISSCDNELIYNVLKQQGFTDILFQIGKSPAPTNFHSIDYFQNVHYFQYIPNLEKEIEKSDLIISHCGAGTMLEILKLKKKAIGVINSKLMNNHQTELAETLSEKNYIVLSTDENFLLNNFQELLQKTRNLDEYPDPNSQIIPSLLEELLQNKS